MTIEMVFFDAGHTVLRPYPSFHELFAQVCRINGVEVEPEEVQQVQERIAPYLVDLADEVGIEAPSLSADDSFAFWTHLYKRILGELGYERPDLLPLFYETFSNTSSYRLFDDVLPVLQELSATGYRLGLISNFEEWLEEMLVELEIGHFFDVKVISGSAGVEKPNRRIYELALEQAGIPADRTVHVGDSPYLDVEPATSAGMRAVLLDRWEREPQSDVPVIATLEELPELLSKMSSWPTERSISES